MVRTGILGIADGADATVLVVYSTHSAFGAEGASVEQKTQTLGHTALAQLETTAKRRGRVTWGGYYGGCVCSEGNTKEPHSPVSEQELWWAPGVQVLQL